METQKATMAASENKLAKMRKTMKIAMQRFTDMKSEQDQLVELLLLWYYCQSKIIRFFIRKCQQKC